MNISRLKKASQYEVQNWLIKELDLTPSQKRKMYDSETIRWAPFTFMKNKQVEKVSFLWRFTMLLLPFYIVLIWVYNPLQFLFTGKWGVSRVFLDNFHYPWIGKLKLNL